VKKITTPKGNLSGQAGIFVIFRGLFFEYNAEIGQKDHLWMETKLIKKDQEYIPVLLK